MSKLFAALVLTALFTSSYAAEDNVVQTESIIPSTTSNELVVRTEEDLARGKENVKSVIAELQTLFQKNMKVDPATIVRRPIAPAYSRIVKGPNGFSTLVYRPRFVSAERMFRAVDGIAAGLASIEVIKENNTVVINDKNDSMEYFKRLLEAMDVPSYQILVEAKVIEVLFNDGMQRNLSINYKDSHVNAGATTSVPGQSGASGGLGGNFNPIDQLDISFRWLLTAQDAKVISSPNILISRFETGRIITAEEIPIQEANTVNNSISFSTTYKKVGVTLEVEPKMINDDNVTIRLYPQVSNVLRYENFPIGGTSSDTYPVPVVSVRSVESFLRMQDQQVVMMGGLYSSRDALQQQRVPILSDIPIIGELFTGKNKSKEITQLIFFVKIHIVSPDSVGDFMYDPNEQAKISNKLGDILDNRTVFPPHEKGITGLVDEMIKSGENEWTPESVQKLREKAAEDRGNPRIDMEKTDNHVEVKNETVK